MSPITLFSLATPNGRKVSIALEELHLPYEAIRIDIRKGEQFSERFLAINPNGKIPAIIDPNGPGGSPIHIFESGAILQYLAEKTGKLLPKEPAAKWEVLQWLYFQVSGVGPMFGQFGHFFKYAGDKCQHPYPEHRYRHEVKRILAVVDKRLEGHRWLGGEEYSIADIATFPWVGCLDWGYEAAEHLGLGEYIHIQRWLEACEVRPASIRGSRICPV